MAKVKGVYKRGSVYWIRYAGLDGKIRRESSGDTSFRDAEDLLIQRKREVREGKAPIPKKRIANHTFGGLSEYYIKWAERQRCFKSKEGFVNQLKKSFANYPLRAFGVRLIDAYPARSFPPISLNRFH